MRGRFYGVSVGPGDPELITLKAKRIIERTGIIVYPVRVRGERSVALEIVKGSTDLSGKAIKELLFEMSPDKKRRHENYKDAIDEITSLLIDNDVAMIVLGDLTVFSTFMRIAGDIRAQGFEAEAVPGVTSFCDGAARAMIPLAMGSEDLKIVPLVKDDSKIDDALESCSNVVFMKAFGSIDSIAEKTENIGLSRSDVIVVSNTGMDGQYIGPMDRTRDYGYFTTVIVKNRRKKE